MSSSSRRFVNASATGPTMVSGILSVCPRRSPYAGVGRRGRGGGDSLSHDDHRHRRVPRGERAIIAPTVERLLGGLPRERFAKDLVAAVNHLKTLPYVKADRIGCVGFCFGGGLSLRLACDVGVEACVVFYGENPSPIERVRDIAGPVLGLYGAEDTRLNADLDKLVKAMAEYKKDFEMRIYPGAPHAFFNDRNPTTYREAAARDAWDRVLRFYRRTLMA